ncbi:hypothetical protein [Amycolatopsis pigmentata]|uniref:Uncharacterized protein n=1 Tax=Amycolatopsis pigmentata TaxID=450801 RepID=A0ABW5GCM1_9PSEU
MVLYQITGRRINDRPDADGWYSSGIDLPTFFVDAVSATDAAAIGHDVAGHGVTTITRTIVQVYRATEDTEEFDVSTRRWTNDRDAPDTR